MEILISDTSVLVDLEFMNLTTQAFGLGYQFSVPDLLYDVELKAYQGPTLLEHGLILAELTPDELKTAIEFRRLHTGLSNPDCFALSVACSRNQLLLTGDGLMRKVARAKKITFHGVLWVLDRIEDAGHASPEKLHSELSKLNESPSCRLPQGEIVLRIERYARKCE
jgi:predicted nucleic acid-binding protein